MSRVIFREHHSLGEEDINTATTRILNSLNRIHHPGYDFVLNRTILLDNKGVERALFWVRVVKRGTVDSVNGKDTDILARGYALLPSSSNPEVLAHAIFEQICMLEQHEVAEFFTYRNSPIFSPHIDPDTAKDFVSGLELDKKRQVYRETGQE